MFCKIDRRHRPPKPVSLRHIALETARDISLLLSFDPFDDRYHLELTSHGHNGLDQINCQLRLFFGDAHILTEGLVNFELVNRESL